MGDKDLMVGRALRESFGQDLLTDPIPDALGAVDVLPVLARSAASPPLDIGWIGIPFPGRTEVVPVVSPAVRAHLHALTEEALAAHRPRPEVFGYRSVSWEYRRGYRARQERLRALGERGDGFRYVLTLDVHRFFGSLPPDALLAAEWMTPGLAARLTEVRARTGRCLLPGHRWASRLGTAVLDPVDTVLADAAPGRWARWGDDWHVVVRDEAEGERIRTAVGAALAGLGLWLSPEKSVVGTVGSLLGGTARDVAGPAGEVWRRGVAADDARALRYALPRLAPTGEVSRALPGVVRERPGLLPRAVRYLDRAVGTAEGLTAVRGTLAATAPGDLFAVGRLLALAGRHRVVAEAVPEALLRSAAGSGVTALCALAVRAAAVGGRPDPLPEPPERLRPWLARGADVRDSPPTVATLL
ncbi:hypothetical protein ABT354_06685 [Streptomyces sp. NPDC000594]|uniref:hypothetical protein n=1 Tax=Streptomyces sp. NPDC000594 TaxID=3154261 RepID=UPI00332E2673